MSIYYQIINLYGFLILSIYIRTMSHMASSLSLRIDCKEINTLSWMTLMYLHSPTHMFYVHTVATPHYTYHPHCILCILTLSKYACVITHLSSCMNNTQLHNRQKHAYALMDTHTYMHMYTNTCATLHTQIQINLFCFYFYLFAF